MAKRISALTAHYSPGRYGEAGEAGVIFREVPALVLHQAAAWPETVDSIAAQLAEAAGAGAAPGPCLAVVGDRATLLRVEPLKWWIYGVAAPVLAPEQGATLDLSHSRTQVRVGGPRAADLLNRHLPIDLRDGSFPTGAVASTAFHHVGVTVWRSQQGFELFMPRGFALSLWQLLLESAAQFGVEVI